MLRRPGATLSPGPAIIVPGNHSSATQLFDKELVTSRPSRGLEQFFAFLRDQVGLSVLDLAGASQQNINFITNLGHRLYSEDFVRTLDDVFGDADPGDQPTRRGSTSFCARRSTSKTSNSTGCWCGTCCNT